MKTLFNDHRIISGFVTLLILLSACFSAVAQNSTSEPVKLGDIRIGKAGDKSEVEKWREDLRFIATELPAKHKNLFHRLDREVFEKAVRELDAKIPELTKNQVALEFARIVALAKDGHTHLVPLFDPNMNFRIFPFSMYMFDDGMFIRKAGPEYKDIVGGKVLKIGKLPVEAAFQRVSPYIPADNEMGQKEYAPLMLSSPEILQALGISDSLEKVNLEIEQDGKKRVVEMKFPAGTDDSLEAMRKAVKTWPDARDTAKDPTPLFLKDQEKMYWFEYVKEKKLLYVQMNSVLDDENQTLEQFFTRVFDFAGKNELDKFVLDLRFNGGGNNTLIRPIIRGLIQMKNIDRPGHLFVVIGRRTFSAAQNLVNQLENWTNVVFVGEPTGSHVNMYGDARSFTLPNSKLRLRISELWWQNKHARDERKWTAPHVAVEFTSDHYKNNVDPVMEAISNYKSRKTLDQIAMEAYKADDFSTFREKVIAYKNDPVNKYQEIEAQINGYGYSLIREKKLDLAIALFQLNVELYPDSFNVYDSLAEAYMLRGEKELAVKFYKKSLELNPDNTNAVQMLEKLNSQK